MPTTLVCIECKALLQTIPQAKELRNTILMVSDHTGISLCQLFGECQHEHITYARHLTWYMLTVVQQHSSTYLAHIFNRSSGTIRSGVGKLRNTTAQNIKKDIETITQNLSNETPN